MLHHLMKQGTDTKLLRISRNFTGDVSNACKEPNPSSLKAGKKTQP